MCKCAKLQPLILPSNKQLIYILKTKYKSLENQNARIRRAIKKKKIK